MVSPHLLQKETTVCKMLFNHFCVSSAQRLRKVWLQKKKTDTFSQKSYLKQECSGVLEIFTRQKQGQAWMMGGQLLIIVSLQHSFTVSCNTAWAESCCVAGPITVKYNCTLPQVSVCEARACYLFAFLLFWFAQGANQRASRTRCPLVFILTWLIAVFGYPAG